MPKRILPRQITAKDKIILDFLHGSINVGEIEAINGESMAGSLDRRIRTHKLEGIKVHCWDGKCILEVVEGHKPIILEQYRQIEVSRERMLGETRERNKARLKDKRYTYNARQKKRRAFVHECVSNTVDKMCNDFAESEKIFLKHEIENKILTIKMPGRAYHVQVAAMIYLLSKCPANSNTPLQFKDVYARYCMCEGHEQITSLYDAIKNAKEQGVQTCRITSEILITSKKDILTKLADENGIPKDEMRGIMSKAIDYAKQEKLKMELMGKNPFVISAAAIYKSRGEHTNISQEQLGNIFNVTSVSIRNTIRRFNEILSPDETKILK